jgi:predicted amidohydrolase YtcJ
MGWLKLFADGSLGTRSAALLAPYHDAHAHPPTGGPSGMVLMDAQELSELLRRAAAAGIVGQVHAIGDRAVRRVLYVYESLPRPAGLQMRRIEHAQLVEPADAPRFGALAVAASVQPVHLRSDARPAREAWGERAENTFPLKALIKGGALIPLGTDAPVEAPDPWPGIAVAVARRDPFDDDQALTGAHNAITLARAVRAACLDPQLVAGESGLGRLMPGSRADLLVVPAGPFEESRPFEPAAFASMRPLATLIDGETAHRDPSFDPHGM